MILFTVEGRLQDNEASMAAMQKQIRALFRVALCSLPKKNKTMKFDEAVADGAEPRLSVQVESSIVYSNFASVLGGDSY